ncbi:hypothetical protein N3K66_002926 [Trichothecium roseum]|uniref:Uncharacterized protein n=1 Tax=Trichothecium roseum TaxID=47278 RepID=A0ACC0V5J9_9HYPO|nr:hypothetical protein N3K66_002926 [Trichothecium roseum]
MATAAKSAPKNLDVLHLYRHLLRECTYLPPSFSGQITGMIRRDFHRFRDNDAGNRHLPARLGRARAALRAARGANNGDAAAMEKLVMKGFGRAGRRRKKLEQEFVLSGVAGKDSRQLEKELGSASDGGQVDGGESYEHERDGVSANQDFAHDQHWRADTEQPNQGRRHYTPPKPPKQRSHGFIDKWNKEKLLALLRSQKQAADAAVGFWGGGPHVIKGRNLDDTKVLPPGGTNIWGKPLHEALVRSKKAKFWKAQVAKVLPPLPGGEWELLERLSLEPQRKTEWKIPERRSAARPLTPAAERDDDAETWDWASYAAKPVNHLEKPPRQRHQRRQAAVGPGQAAAPGPYQGKSGARTISDRRFRHMYRRAWAYSPRATQNPKTLATKYEWGATSDKIFNGASAPSKMQMEIFEGVDTNGMPVKA